MEAVVRLSGAQASKSRFCAASKLLRSTKCRARRQLWFHSWVFLATRPAFFPRSWRRSNAVFIAHSLAPDNVPWLTSLSASREVRSLLGHPRDKLSTSGRRGLVGNSDEVQRRSAKCWRCLNCSRLLVNFVV